MTPPIQPQAVRCFDEPPLTGAQVNALLNISTTTRWRLEKRGLLLPIANMRRKLYAQVAIRNFIHAGLAKSGGSAR